MIRDSLAGKQGWESLTSGRCFPCPLFRAAKNSPAAVMQLSSVSMHGENRASQKEAAAEQHPARWYPLLRVARDDVYLICALLPLPFPSSDNCREVSFCITSTEHV